MGIGRRAFATGTGNCRSRALTRFEVRVLRKILEFGLLAAVLLAVGGFGGTEPVAWGVSEVLILLLGLFLVVLPAGKQTRRYWKLLWFPLMLGAWIAAQWFASRSGRIGFDTHAIESRGLAFATSAVAFFLALEVARERASRQRLALCLVGLAVFEAFYGLVQYLAGWQYIWNVPRRFYLGAATGTYINHNHYAGLLEMILPLALALAFYHWQKARRFRRRSVRALFDHFTDPEMRKCFLMLLAAIVLLVAVVFSFSRMGMISTLVSLGAMAAVVWIGRRRAPVPAALIVVLLAGGVATAAWVGVGPVVEHFEQLPQNEPLANATEGRVALWKNSAELIRAHPWTGVGVGCFEYAFTGVQHVGLTYVADHAHNDYVELAAELGLPCAALLFTMIFWLVFRILQAALTAASSLARSLALGSLGAAVALLAHSVADFNLYIPANALVFAVILGMGYAMSLDERAPAHEKHAGHACDAASKSRARPRPRAAETPGEIPVAVKWEIDLPVDRPVKGSGSG
jgi:O-antigen ligase